MILILEPNSSPESDGYKFLESQLGRLPGIKYRVHREVGAEVTLTEIYLIGNTGALTVEQMQVLPCVAKVVRDNSRGYDQNQSGAPQNYNPPPQDYRQSQSRTYYPPPQGYGQSGYGQSGYGQSGAYPAPPPPGPALPALTG